MSSTREFGPPLWKSMFIIATNYPVTINENDKKHISLKKHYKSFYTNFKHTLPCRFCRESYSEFLKDLPIDDFLDSRKNIVMWLYKIKDMVNKKLINQEKLLIDMEIGKIKNPSKSQIASITKKLSYTTPSPPFKDVFEYYMKFKAKSCSKITKTCK